VLREGGEGDGGVQVCRQGVDAERRGLAEQADDLEPGFDGEELEIVLQLTFHHITRS